MYRESLRREETCVQEGLKGQCGWSGLSGRERRSGRGGREDIREFDVGGLGAGVLTCWEGRAVLIERMCAGDAGAPGMTRLGPNWAILCRWSTRAGVDCGKGRGQDEGICVSGGRLEMEADFQSPCWMGTLDGDSGQGWR